MQLSFLGQTYEINFTPIEMAETSETGTFMGQTYVRRQPQVEPPQQAPEELIFMGQRYTRTDASQSLPCKPRPGDRTANSRQALQLERSRWSGRRHSAFRS